MSNNSGNGGTPPPSPPSRILTLNPTRNDAGTTNLVVTILYDPVQKVVQVKGPAGVDIVGLVGILELAKNSVFASVMRRPL
jgi:hypothetical protein